ncbi:DUF1127 domain-containing protein [Roseomonas elaeocarpi]|uniref:DUF1127 domain-containing protein n=1 Tax=Roseomonas elaeocarpi TaxID=907779 RepID=A0ABV6JU35_9PROT
MNPNFNQTEASLMMPRAANAETARVQALRQQAMQQSDAGLGRWFSGLFARLSEGLARRRAMAELQELSDRELADIGLNRAEIPGLFARMGEQVVAAPARTSVVRPANDFRQGRAAA